MKKKLLLLFTLVLCQNGFSQKKIEGPLDLTSTKVENCILENNKTVTCYKNSGRIYLPFDLPFESRQEIKGLNIVFSKFIKLGEASDTLGAINVLYTDYDGNEKKAAWAFYKDGKKTVYFDAFEINRDKETVKIDPTLIKEIYLSFGINKRVDVSVTFIK